MCCAKCWEERLSFAKSERCVDIVTAVCEVVVLGLGLCM